MLLSGALRGFDIVYESGTSCMPAKLSNSSVGASTSLFCIINNIM